MRSSSEEIAIWRWENSNGVGNVFDELFAQVLEHYATSMAQVIAHAPRNADLTAYDEALELGGHIDAIAK